MKQGTWTAAGVLALSAGAFGQAGTGFTITDGDVVFSQVDSPVLATAVAVAGAALRFNGPAGPDQLYEHWWWFRVQGDTREYPMFGSSGTVPGVNSATTTWTLSNQPGSAAYNFTAALTSTVTDTGANLGTLEERMLITNNGAATLNLNLFSYADLDVNGTSGGDSASGGIPTITVTDGSWNIRFEGPGAAHYQVTSFSTLRGLLSNTSVNDLADTGLPFAAGDWTGAFQWVLSIPAGQQASVISRLTAGPPPAPCYANCDASTAAPCLNVLDFNCFLNRFSAGDSSANCDASTTPPVLNVLDFNCFLNRFSAGCSNC